MLKILGLTCLALCARAEVVNYTHQAVAAVLMAEAWNQGSNGMVAVLEVMHERAAPKKRTLLQEISVPRAYTCLNRTSVEALIRRFSAYPDFQKALAVARIPASKLPGIARRANHFTRKDERPSWAKGRRPVAVIKDHAFYRL